MLNVFLLAPKINQKLLTDSSFMLDSARIHRLKVDLKSSKNIAKISIDSPLARFCVRDEQRKAEDDNLDLSAQFDTSEKNLTEKLRDYDLSLEVKNAVFEFLPARVGAHPDFFRVKINDFSAMKVAKDVIIVGRGKGVEVFHVAIEARDGKLEEKETSIFRLEETGSIVMEARPDGEIYDMYLEMVARVIDVVMPPAAVILFGIFRTKARLEIAASNFTRKIEKKKADEATIAKAGSRLKIDFRADKLNVIFLQSLKGEDWMKVNIDSAHWFSTEEVSYIALNKITASSSGEAIASILADPESGSSPADEAFGLLYSELRLSGGVKGWESLRRGGSSWTRVGKANLRLEAIASCFALGLVALNAEIVALFGRMRGVAHGTPGGVEDTRPPIDSLTAFEVFEAEMAAAKQAKEDSCPLPPANEAEVWADVAELSVESSSLDSAVATVRRIRLDSTTGHLILGGFEALGLLRGVGVGSWRGGKAGGSGLAVKVPRLSIEISDLPKESRRFAAFFIAALPPLRKVATLVQENAELRAALAFPYEDDCDRRAFLKWAVELSELEVGEGIGSVDVDVENAIFKVVDPQTTELTIADDHQSFSSPPLVLIHTDLERLSFQFSNAQLCFFSADRLTLRFFGLLSDPESFFLCLEAKSPRRAIKGSSALAVEAAVSLRPPLVDAFFNYLETLRVHHANSATQLAELSELISTAATAIGSGPSPSPSTTISSPSPLTTTVLRVDSAGLAATIGGRQMRIDAAGLFVDETSTGFERCGVTASIIGSSGVGIAEAGGFRLTGQRLVGETLKVSVLSEHFEIYKGFVGEVEEMVGKHRKRLEELGLYAKVESIRKIVEEVSDKHAENSYSETHVDSKPINSSTAQIDPTADFNAFDQAFTAENLKMDAETRLSLYNSSAHRPFSTDCASSHLGLCEFTFEDTETDQRYSLRLESLVSFAESEKALFSAGRGGLTVEPVSGGSPRSLLVGNENADFFRALVFAKEELSFAVATGVWRCFPDIDCWKRIVDGLVRRNIDPEAIVHAADSSRSPAIDSARIGEIILHFEPSTPLLLPAYELRRDSNDSPRLADLLNKIRGDLDALTGDPKTIESARFVIEVFTEGLRVALSQKQNTVLGREMVEALRAMLFE